jgi:hypothetical protein
LVEAAWQTMRRAGREAAYRPQPCQRDLEERHIAAAVDAAGV